MDFAEFLTVFSLFVILPSIVFTNIRKMKEAKYRAKIGVGEEGSALRLSELDALIQEAVDEAVAPLERRIRLLERERRAGGHPAGVLEAPAPLLALGGAEEEPEEAPVHSRSRTRP